MRNLTVVAFALCAFGGSTLLSGCAAIAATHTPLFQATVRQDRDEIFPLLAKDKNLEIKAANPQGRELITAILERRKPDVSRLIEAGADVNAVIVKSESSLYNTYNPLMFAVWDDDMKLVDALLAKGADVNYKAAFGSSAAYLVQTSAMLKRLLDAGCPVDDGSDTRWSLLSANAVGGKVEAVKLLLARGADVEKARALIQGNIKTFRGVGIAESDDAMVKQKEGIQLIDRLLQPPAPAPQTAAAGVTKEEFRQMMKEAAAETSRPAPAPAAAAVTYKSDVDAPAYKVSENPDAYALVVGVEKYNTLPDARFAERDAKAMNAHLLAMGYPQRNIVLLTGTQATRTGLAKNLEAWLPNNVTERSTVLFFFSGHGAPDAKTSQAYLVPMDGDPQYLEETAYPIKRLYAKLAALKAKRVVVALDSCFSGAGGRSVLAQGTRPLVAKLELGPVEEKVVSLSASASDEVTGALEDQGHGLFTYNLLKALTETAGRGTVGEVYAALKPRVQDEARRQNRAQTPQAFGRSLDSGLR